MVTYINIAVLTIYFLQVKYKNVVFEILINCAFK